MNQECFVIRFVPWSMESMDLVHDRLREGEFAGLVEMSTPVDRLASPAEVILEVEALGLPTSVGVELFVMGGSLAYWSEWIKTNADLMNVNYHATVQLAEQKDWVKEYRQTVQPFVFAQKFWVYPSWANKEECPTGLMPLEVEPSMAFGTGEHETTQTCAQALIEITQNERKTRGLDLGCGSGILALVMDRLKISYITAIDNDELSLENTRILLEKNTHTSNVRVIWGETPNHILNEGPFDVIVANILLSACQDYVKVFPKISDDGCHWVFSGLLDSQESELRQSAEAAGGVYLYTLAKNEWRTVVFRFEKISRDGRS